MRAFLIALGVLNGRPRRKIALNTYVEQIDENQIGVKLHKTFVVIFQRSGPITLNSGGWTTATTCKRINQALGLIFKASRYSVSIRQGDMYYFGPGTPVAFKDGLQINEITGRPTNYWELE